MRLAFALPFACTAALGTTAFGQSLGEIAKAEEARRAAITQPVKVYTDKDLVASSGVPVSTPLPAPSQPPASTAVAKPVEAVAQTKSPVKDETYWKDRMRVLRAQLDSDETFEREAAARERRLSVEAQREPIIPSSLSPYESDRHQYTAVTRAWHDAVAETGRLRAAILNDKRAITLLEEEARRAGVPPGWLLP